MLLIFFFIVLALVAFRVSVGRYSYKVSISLELLKYVVVALQYSVY